MGRCLLLGGVRILFLLADTAHRFVGIPVGIGSNQRRKQFQIQLLMVLGDCRPGAPQAFFPETIPRYSRRSGPKAGVSFFDRV